MLKFSHCEHISEMFTKKDLTNELLSSVKVHMPSQRIDQLVTSTTAIFANVSKSFFVENLCNFKYIFVPKVR